MTRDVHILPPPEQKYNRLTAVNTKQKIFAQAW